jgi:hypothetical protein
MPFKTEPMSPGRRRALALSGKRGNIRTEEEHAAPDGHPTWAGYSYPAEMGKKRSRPLLEQQTKPATHKRPAPV